MPLNETLDRIKDQLTGSKTGRDDTKLLLDTMRGTSGIHWYVQVLEAYPLAGTTFYLSEDEDLSEIGVEMQWMSPEESLDEISNAYPGIDAHKKGYIPVGICLVGSGDPYFIKTNSSGFALVRIPHDACRGGELDETQIELVCDNVTDFFLKASIG